MSDTAIFVVGTFTFLLLSGGFFYTVLEVRRIEEETKANRQSRQAVGSDGPANKK
jgi:CHASE3 domain sensor protein